MHIKFNFCCLKLIWCSVALNKYMYQQLLFFFQVPFPFENQTWHFRCLLHVSHSEVMDFWLQVRFPCTEIWWENAVTWKTRLHVSAANYLKDKYFSRFSRFSFSGTNGAVFKIAILCMVCNKLFCSVRVYYSGRCFKRKRVWPLLNVLQCLKKISYSLQKFQDCNHNVIHVTEAWCL